MPIPNEDRLRDRYDRILAPELEASLDVCAVCGDEEFDMPDTHMGRLCSSCTRKCTICGDWLLGEIGEAHKECADDL